MLSAPQGGIFGRLSQQQGQPYQEDAQQGGWGQGYRGAPFSLLLLLLVAMITDC